MPEALFWAVRSGSSDFRAFCVVVDGRWKLIHHVARRPEKPEYELFDCEADPLDQRDVAAAHYVK